MIWTPGRPAADAAGRPVCGRPPAGCPPGARRAVVLDVDGAVGEGPDGLLCDDEEVLVGQAVGGLDAGVAVRADGVATAMLGNCDQRLKVSPVGQVGRMFHQVQGPPRTRASEALVLVLNRNPPMVGRTVNPRRHIAWPSKIDLIDPRPAHGRACHQRLRMTARPRRGRPARGPAPRSGQDIEGSRPRVPLVADARCWEPPEAWLVSLARAASSTSRTP